MNRQNRDVIQTRRAEPARLLFVLSDTIGSRAVSHVRACLTSMAVAALAFTPAAQGANNLVYEIFVRSFADTPADSATAGASGEIGDLRGIRENLDYLNDGDPATDTDLEVGILWLMPIFPSRSYHGYDIDDYRNVSPDYGTVKDFRDLAQAAHQRGMRIILDIAFNHTSSEHPWFKQAIEDPSSPFFNYYHILKPDKPTPSGPWHTVTNTSGQTVRYLGLFSPHMPDLNLAEPAVRKEIKAAAEFWITQGADGFRLDAAKHVYGDTFDPLPEWAILKNNDWWREFSDHVYAIKPDAILVGEVLGDRETLRRHAFGNDALLDEPFMHATRWQVAFPQAGFVTRWRDALRACRDVNQLAHAGPGAMARDEPFQLYGFLASHDQNPRLASYLQEMERMQMKASADEAYRLALCLLCTIPTYPVLYCGDELGQFGFKWNGNPPDARSPGDGSGIYDETLREPFPWKRSGRSAPQTGWFAARFDAPDDGVSVEEQDKTASLLGLTRALTNLRTAHPALANGEIGEILSDSGEWMVFEKVAGAERYVVLVNTGETGLDYRFHATWYPRYQDATLIFWSDGKQKAWKDETQAKKRIDSSVYVPAYGMVVLKQTVH